MEYSRGGSVHGARNVTDFSRAELETLYRHALALVILLAQILGYPCPVVTREERRRDRAIDSEREIMVR